MNTLKAILKNWRYYIILIGAALTAVLLLCSPTAEDIVAWASTFILTKFAGLATLAILVALCMYWKDRGEIDELVNIVREEDQW